jgi:flagellar FliJ protein
VKFKFPLQNVLGYRKTLEDLAQREFQLAMADMQVEIQKLEKMLEDKKEAREQAFQTQVKGGAAAESLSQVADFIKGQDLRLDRQKAKIQECEKRVEELREILRLKAIDYKIIEGLRDQKKEQFRVEQNKLEQKQADESSVMRFRRTK